MKFELQKGSRSRILAIGLLAIAAIFVVRLFYLQVIQYSHYVAQAQAEQQKQFVIPAERGMIYAKNGDEPVRLVMNQSVYTVYADPQTVTDKDEIVEALKEVAGGNLVEGFADLLDAKESRYKILGTKLSRTQAELLKEKGFSGIGFQETSQRVYPEGTLAAQLLGYVDTENEGKYGLEGYLNDELSGVDGSLVAVTDVSEVPLTIGNKNVRIPEQDGKNVVLSIDRSVQSKVEQALKDAQKRTGAKEVSAMVMDPNSGKVLAMANYPTYDPEKYYEAKDVALFNNNVVSGTYEPGSTIKTFTMATGIEKNAVRPSDTFNNTDFIKIGDWTISNATRGITGTISFQTALEWSLNTGFVTIGQRLGNGTSITPAARQTMYDYYYNKFRLGQATGIELANEASGLVIAPDDQRSSEIRYANMTFGQGMEATMIQVASGFSALVNGGTYYQPTVIDGYMEDGEFKQNESPTPVATGIVQKSTSDTLKSMMIKARQSGFPGVDKSGYRIGGKTGTSQVSSPQGGYSDDESIASYVGFGGSDAPEYVIMVQVSGKDQIFQGARDALPIFTDISNWMLEYLKIQPKG